MAAPRPRRPLPHETEVIVLVGGPIASGKTTVSHAAASELRSRGFSAAVVDVDVVYEMLEPRGRSPGKPVLWSRARRLAGAIARQLTDDGTDVVLVEGGFLDPMERAEIGATAKLVILRAAFETALRRVGGDHTRGISRDESFLRQHYEETIQLFAGLPGDALVLDTTDVAPAEMAREIAALSTR